MMIEKWQKDDKNDRKLNGIWNSTEGKIMNHLDEIQRKAHDNSDSQTVEFDLLSPKRHADNLLGVVDNLQIAFRQFPRVLLRHDCVHLAEALHHPYRSQSINIKSLQHCQCKARGKNSYLFAVDRGGRAFRGGPGRGG